MANQMRLNWRVASGIALLVGAATLMTVPLISDDLQAENLMANIVVTGTLTNEGIECPAMRGDDGQLYTLRGDLMGFKDGQRVEIEAESLRMSPCMQGKTVRITKIKKAEPN